MMSWDDVSVTTEPWPAPTADVAIDAVVDLPGSKSLMARHLVLAALAEGPTTIVHPLRSRDSELMAEGLRRLGSRVRIAEQWHVAPGEHRTGRSQTTSVDCGLAGTVMRFLPPLAALGIGTVAFDGDPRARERPMAGLLDAMRDLGIGLDPPTSSALPFAVLGRGHVKGGQVTVRAGASSQFVSALLLAGCRFEQGVHVLLSGPVPSRPHVDMTLAAMTERGLAAEWLDEASVRVRPGSPSGGVVVLEPDLSNAAPFLAAALLTGGEVRVPDWPATTTQAGRALPGLLARMGARVELDDRGLRLRGTGAVTGLGRVDLSEVGELTPVLAAVAALAEGTTQIVGVAHLRGHETDRLAALAGELNALGGQVEQTPDGLLITPRRLHGGLVGTHDDHRMATAAAVLGLVVPGITLDDVRTTAKTMPEFPDRWAAMLGEAPPSRADAVLG